MGEYQTVHEKEFDQPSSIEAEKAVLGGLLLKPDLWDTVSVTVDEKIYSFGTPTYLSSNQTLKRSWK